MKKLMLLLVAVSLFACSKEDVSRDYFEKIQGKWKNQADNSTLEFYQPVLYVNTDTLKVACDYELFGNQLTIVYSRYRYQYTIDAVNDTILILYKNDYQRIYKKFK